MFDIGFSELLLFGVIALIVLGPEKLPQAARTAGQWYAKIRQTVSTLQSEIEAELDLAETRQQMQKEFAKIRQTEADMKREMAEMRGSMQEFEYSQNQSLNAAHQPHPPHDQVAANKAVTAEQSKPAEFAYAYDSNPNPSSNQDKDYQQEPQTTDSIKSPDDTKPLTDTSANTAVQPIITKPWENMWFRLGAYDKARRLPSPPRLPNYQADALLHVSLNKKGQSTPQASTADQPDTPSSLNKQEESE